ncbi:MAG: hypothetical protein AABX11_05220 [Nanoarchaeota archaeon]
MAADIHKLIAAISPDTYCDEEVKSEVKKITKESGYLKASEKAKPVDPVFMDLIDIQYESLLDAPGIKKAIEKHVLINESTGESFEQLYYWIIDKLNDELGSDKVEKLWDSFVSSPTSQHFTEMISKSKNMQEEAMKMLGSANQVLKSIIQLLYDLREFKIRLQPYAMMKSKEAGENERAMLTLKQIWLDTVDIKRGNSSIKAMALGGQSGFVTLIDAFIASEGPDLKFQGKEIDLNDRVKRILKQRLQEFVVWLKESEEELKKRFSIEKIYLRSQVNTLKLYSKWAKPYLKAARLLEQNATSTASIANAFSTAIFEVTLFGKSEYKPKEDIDKAELPGYFKNIKKKFFAILVTELKFRSLPERAGQGYSFKVRAEVTFTSYGLSEDELKVLKKELDNDDINDSLKLMEGATTESLDLLQNEINEYLDEKTDEQKKEEKKNEDVNPFTSLFAIFKSSSSDKKKDETKKDGKIELKSDSDDEKVLRSQAIIDARKRCYRVYDLYKKTHKMPSLPGYA